MRSAIGGWVENSVRDPERVGDHQRAGRLEPRGAGERALGDADLEAAQRRRQRERVVRQLGAGRVGLVLPRPRLIASCRIAAAIGPSNTISSPTNGLLRLSRPPPKKNANFASPTMPAAIVPATDEMRMSRL